MPSFSVNLSCRGKSIDLPHITTCTTGIELHELALEAIKEAINEENVNLKLILKGRRIESHDSEPVFSGIPKKTPSVMAIVSSAAVVSAVQAKRSDPTIRGFDNELKRDHAKIEYWGPDNGQDRSYKFVKLEACTWQSFGHRPTDQTPHAFLARQLLEKLSTDPGIVAVMRERELVVNTLGEMDPVDDRIMHKTNSKGACLLGYNTNHGLRIDVKLRTDDLRGFRPYAQLVGTLLHELSHNWVGEHDILFWSNYAEMRAEYLFSHARLRSNLVNGTTTAEIAGLPSVLLENVYDFIMTELQKEMGQHGLHPMMIQEVVAKRIQDLEQKHVEQRLGGMKEASGNPRELARQAAERRARNRGDGQEKNPQR